jgi:site-specific DNA-methyltransferase (adenine-specific)
VSRLSILTAVDSRTRTETKTSAFGSGRRESHDASAFYARFAPPIISDDETVNRPDGLIAELGQGRVYTGSIDTLTNLPDNSVALVVTSPPYFVGKEYELAISEGGENGPGPIPSTYLDFLDMLRGVFAECRRVLEPGGRIAVNVANLGRKPYRSLSADVISILQDDLGLLLRGEVIWEKSSASSGSCAWGSFGRASNPVLRDVTERVVIASKGRFARAISVKDREAQGLPHRSTMTNDEFVDVTRDVWRLDAESAKRVGHPAPFPIDLPRRLIDLYTYVGDLVVDPFAGSGTALVAAARTGRIGIGYDTDPAYVDLSNERLNAELVARDDADVRSDGTRHDEVRLERTVDLAVIEGKKVHDIAKRHLTDAGFTVVGENVRHPSKLLDLSFLVEGADGEWWVDVAGAFITGNAGLTRTDAVWRLIGRLHAIAAAVPADVPAVDSRRVLVLTPQLPRRRSPADRALRSVGPGVLYDCIELYDSAGGDRLQAYAAGTAPDPKPGFWQRGDLPAELVE